MEEHDDDLPVGHVLTRREMLALLGGWAVVAACAPTATPEASPTIPVATPTAADSISVAPSPPVASSATASAATSATSVTNASPAATPVALATATGAPVATVPNCVVAPELTEGPYFVDGRLDRSDVRSDAASGKVVPGTPLVLAFQISQAAGGQCLALGGAMVDIWQCDAVGRYSDVGETAGQSFLRGFQLTGDDGLATFTTIYPGWYPGRAVHIHFKVRTAGGEFTSQLFFDEAVTAEAYQREPYASRGLPNVPNERDGIFLQSGGQLTVLPLATADGYAASFHLAIAG